MAWAHADNNNGKEWGQGYEYGDGDWGLKRICVSSSWYISLVFLFLFLFYLNFTSTYKSLQINYAYDNGTNTFLSPARDTFASWAWGIVFFSFLFLNSTYLQTRIGYKYDTSLQHRQRVPTTRWCVFFPFHRQHRALTPPVSHTDSMFFFVLPPTTPASEYSTKWRRGCPLVSFLLLIFFIYSTNHWLHIDYATRRIQHRTTGRKNKGAQDTLMTCLGL